MKIKIEAQKGSARLDKFLATHVQGLSRAQIQRLIFDGRVAVDGKTVNDKNIKLRGGESVSMVGEEKKLLPRPDIALNLVYEDGDVAVIEKPAGLVVHPNPGVGRDSVAAALLAKIPQTRGVGEDSFRPGIVHRLDADTSGLLLVAKTQAAFEFLKAAFKARRVVKFYTALVHGRMEKSYGMIEEPIGRKSGRGRYETGFGREAKTEYWVEREFGDGVDQYTLLKIQLHTGRTHQIRVHMASLGHPVAGDKVYGGRFKRSDTHIFPRQFLHASYLKLKLPGGSEKEFSSELPEDLQEALQQFSIIHHS
jgi:23S rRNA pseudouridine1911/1915/1917 synthase